MYCPCAQVGQFLKAVREQLVPEFRELRHVSVENLLYIKVLLSDLPAGTACTFITCMLIHLPLRRRTSSCRTTTPSTSSLSTRCVQGGKSWLRGGQRGQEGQESLGYCYPAGSSLGAASFPSAPCTAPVLHVHQARGKSGPLFDFSVHDDIRIVSDASREKNETHAGKVGAGGQAM